MGKVTGYFLGVDGGGTSTRAFVADGAGNVIGKGYGSSSNYLYAGIPATSAAISDATHTALDAAGVEVAELAAAFFGMAGVLNEAGRDAIRSAIAPLRFDERTVTGIDHDIRIALTGGLAGDPGIALIVGTGSACYGRNADNKAVQCGGWGALADDPGSAYWVAVEALRTAVRQADGRLPESELMHVLFGELGIERIEDLHRCDKEFERDRIARLCPAIIDLWEDGDSYAAAILEEGVGALAQMVEVTAEKLRLAEPSIVVTGGLWDAGKPYQRLLKAAIQKVVPGGEIREVRMTPVQGAVLEARRLVEEGGEKKFLTNLRSTGA